MDEINTSIRMAIKTAGSPWSSREAILHAIAGVNKDIVVDFRTLDEDMGAAVMQERLIASLSAFFGGLALLLAALGLYGVMSYSVSRRRNEIGIRMALGAEPDSVIRLVLRHVAVITAIGILIGVAGGGGDRPLHQHVALQPGHLRSNDDRRDGGDAGGGRSRCRLSPGPTRRAHRSDDSASRRLRCA